ncbi:alpha/beta hydrolase fold domain-containing protein [Phenylobacterium sp.]|jgi:acetyl esterase|uniref:alpha/beta hydrolase fold domain-containing protein n=1 Tax=Phenylobacterium sp. TaxID=1871053 RepID=UPI002E36B33F|nr:alpha/beta hydrolase fold domain-containing protein [Phenylobacterium sp.]HEX3367460.1 alpha/beta hydrolase fold domain-containing protein [Phenylobacterium sp.]
MPAAADLEPAIQRFVETTGKAYAKLTPPGPWSAPVARAVAEKVREPWRQGGPEMHEAREAEAPTRHGPVRLRLYRPNAGRLEGALVYLHGGGFTIFSLDTHDRVMRELAVRAGVAVIGVDYALAPEAKFPVALEQVVDTVRWLADDGGKVLDLEGVRLAIGGDSAGGNLSFGAAITLRDAGEGQLLSGIVTAYGGFGVIASDEITARYGGPGYILTREESLKFWENYLNDPSERQNPLVCPLRANLKGLPPVFLAIPRCDINSEQNFQMADALKAAGVPVEAEVYEGATHSFLEAMSISPVANRALDDMAHWVARTLAISPHVAT